MQIINEAAKKSGKDLYAQQFEFRYCTGSIEIEDENPLPPVKKEAAYNEEEER